MKKSKIALYPGSFDPFTNGHLDILTRASKLFDKIYVLVAINLKKQASFTIEERCEMIKLATNNLTNIEVISSNDLVINEAKKLKANYIIRGIRNHADFDMEMELFSFNYQLDSKIETIFLCPSPKNLFISSTAVKELCKFNANIDKYVPSSIKDLVYKKFSK